MSFELFNPEELAKLREVDWVGAADYLYLLRWVVLKVKGTGYTQDARNFEDDRVNNQPVF